MKLYRTQQLNDRGHVCFTRFTESLVEARRTKQGAERWRIVRGSVPNTITLSTWIQLLEGDAPGMQAQNLTPVDCFIAEEIVDSKGWDS